MVDQRDLKASASLRSVQSSPGYLQAGHVPSNCTRQMPQTSSSGMSHRQDATAFHCLMVTFMPPIKMSGRAEIRVRSATSLCVGEQRNSTMQVCRDLAFVLTISAYYVESTCVGPNASKPPRLRFGCLPHSIYSNRIPFPFALFFSSMPHILPLNLTSDRIDWLQL
jgi:hypothetical protein